MKYSKWFACVFLFITFHLMAKPAHQQHNNAALSKYRCVVVYQFGKVGSWSLKNFFNSYLLSIHTHYPHKSPRNKSLEELLITGGEKKILVVNAMRNVFDRNISCLSQHIKRGKVRMPKNYGLDDLLRFFPSYSLKEDEILQPWYENFNKLLGVHIFDQPFDFENKYYFESTDKCDVLVLRFEDIAQWPGILEKALDLKGVRFPWDNSESIPLYKEFKKAVRYPQSEVERILSIDFMQHFYTPEELSGWVEKYVAS